MNYEEREYCLLKISSDVLCGDTEVVRPCQYLQLNAFLGENASPSK